MNNDKIIEVKNLEFSYKNKLVFDNVSFEVGRGNFICLLGPNGAGKSTITKILTGQLAYNKGNIRIFGKEVKDIQQDLMKRIGILSDNFALPEEFTVREVLMFSAKAFGFDNTKAKDVVNRLIKEFSLESYAKFLLKKLSSGMRRRVEIAQALVNESEIIFLDEPTNALDPQSSQEIRALIKQINQRGITIVYTTHLLNEIEDMYTSVAFINQGAIKLYAKEEIIHEGGEKLAMRFKDGNSLSSALDIINKKGIKFRRDNLIISLLNGNAATILDEFRHKGIDIAETSLGKVSLAMLYNNCINS